MIRGRNYRVIEQLSSSNRGRWKVWEPDPRPQGTYRAIVVLPEDAASVQFKNALSRMLENQVGFPRLIAWDRADGQLRLVLPWCNGIDLKSYLDRVRASRAQRPSLWESIRRIRSLAHALSVLHRRCQVVHGDIKPANLVLPSDPGSISMIDFGSCWPIERTFYRVEGDGVDQFYSAPEFQLDATIITPKADQFSAAIVLYEMLTLQRPYAGLGGKAGLPQFRAEAERAYQKPSQLLQNRKRIPQVIRDELDLLLGRALHLDPEYRFGNCQQFAEALDTLWLRLQATKVSHELNAVTTLGRLARMFGWRNRMLE